MGNSVYNGKQPVYGKRVSVFNQARSTTVVKYG